MLLAFFLMVLVFKVNPDYWDVTLNHSLNPGLYLESKSIKNYKHCHTHTKKIGRERMKTFKICAGVNILPKAELWSQKSINM